MSSFEFLSPQNMEIDTLLNKIGQKIRFPTKIKYLYVCTLALSGKYAKFQSPITPKPKKIEKNFDTLQFIDKWLQIMQIWTIFKV